MIKFAYPLLLLLLILPYFFRAICPVLKQNLGSALKVPFLKDLQKIAIESGQLWGGVSEVAARNFKLLALWVIWIFLIFALARPQLIGEPIRIKTNARDILMLMDISTSMLERDFVLYGKRVNRLTAVKNMATNFVKGRGDDKLGLILFGTRAYLQAPISYDKKSVEEILWQMEAGMAGNSTAIGDALGLGLKYLKESSNLDKKVMILLTDGENNDGFLSVAQATKLAQDEGVKVYTIGVGSQNNMMQAMFGNQGVDEKSLQEIAKATEGQYFRAKDANSLAAVYAKIDKLEPIETNTNTVVQIKELFYIPLLLAIFLTLSLLILVRGKNNE